MSLINGCIAAILLGLLILFIINFPFMSIIGTPGLIADLALTKSL